MENKIYKIGTRASKLAMFQANKIKDLLQELNIKSEIVPINSSGDINLVQPLYKMNITGVFTKELDIALINNQIDIAVHSLKDVPTLIPENLMISACLERDFPQDVLVRNPNSNKKGLDNLLILTGSLRRQAFWKNYNQNVSFGQIRGNVQTRLEKLNNSNADATIFSLAGIKRMNLDLKYEYLDFMIPAPAQGIIACISRKDDLKINEILQKINHSKTEIESSWERKFLSELEGGCSVPIGSFAEINNDLVTFKAQVCSLCGTEKVYINQQKNINDFSIDQIIEQALNKGAKKIIEDIKNNI